MTIRGYSFGTYGAFRSSNCYQLLMLPLVNGILHTGRATGTNRGSCPVHTRIVRRCYFLSLCVSIGDDAPIDPCRFHVNNVSHHIHR